MKLTQTCSLNAKSLLRFGMVAMCDKTLRPKCYHLLVFCEEQQQAGLESNLRSVARKE